LSDDDSPIRDNRQNVRLVSSLQFLALTRTDNVKWLDYPADPTLFEPEDNWCVHVSDCWQYFAERPSKNAKALVDEYWASLKIDKVIAHEFDEDDDDVSLCFVVLHQA
jgi:hypothetical protein